MKHIRNFRGRQLSTKLPAVWYRPDGLNDYFFYRTWYAFLLMDAITEGLDLREAQ